MLELENVKLLKQEINDCIKIQYDITKWKIISIATLSAAAMGINNLTKSNQWSELLILIPFACGYFDTVFYQNLLRVYVIASFIREETSGIISEYEKAVERLRNLRNKNRNDFYYENVEYSCSLLASFIAMVVFFADLTKLQVHRNILWLVLAVCGIIFIHMTKRNFKAKIKEIDKLGHWTSNT